MFWDPTFLQTCEGLRSLRIFSGLPLCPRGEEDFRTRIAGKLEAYLLCGVADHNDYSSFRYLRSKECPVEGNT